MKLVGDNIEKDFYVDCDGNETIHFFFFLTAPELGRGYERKIWAGAGMMKIMECNSLCQMIAHCGRDKKCMATCAAECAKNPNYQPMLPY